jgi:hypothetical protein
VYFAYHRRSKPTGELLAAVLQMPHGENPSESQWRDTLIRWGNRKDNQMDDGFDKVINDSEAINVCSNKLESLEKFQDEEIAIPDFDTDPELLIDRVGYPILGRKLRHARGEDIKLILQERDLRRCNSDYFVQYIPTNREFRIHVVGNEVIRVQGKYLDNSAEVKPWIRNYSTGYRFRKPRLRLNQDRLDMAVRAVNCLGLDFGAVDLLIADDRSCCVLEVNTAPSCSPFTLAAYAVALHELAGLDTEIDLSYLDMLDPDLEEMDSDDEGEQDE